MFLLDTNVISELKKVDRADRHVVRWASANRASGFFLSVITVFELELGAQRAARTDSLKAAHLRDWIDNYVLPSFTTRILPIGTDIALRCAALHVPDPKSDRDAFIAATALVHGFTVVTRNTRDFQTTGVLLLNPWRTA
jgi:predicted nucleic acid-binding protein